MMRIRHSTSRISRVLRGVLQWKGLVHSTGLLVLAGALSVGTGCTGSAASGSAEETVVSSSGTENMPPEADRATAVTENMPLEADRATAATETMPLEANGATAVTENEMIYASVLSTRRHQLSGENPVVGLFMSSDGGDTWRHTGWKQGRTFAAMEVSGSGGDTLFVAAGNGVMRTTDAGRSWKIVTGWRVTEVQDITVTPSNSSQVYAATPYGVFRSDDFGAAWAEYSGGLESKFVASIRVDRTDTRRVFAGTEAGLFVSHDEGEMWTPTPVSSPVRSVRQSPVDPRRWMAGLQDDGVALSSDGGETWRSGAGIIADATIYEAEFHPTDPNKLYAGGWQTGLLRSSDFGATWERLVDGLEELSVHGIAVSRREPGLVLVGTMGAGLYRSRDDGEHWHVAAPEVFEAGQVWDLYVAGEQ